VIARVSTIGAYHSTPNLVARAAYKIAVIEGEKSSSCTRGKVRRLVVSTNENENEEMDDGCPLFDWYQKI
jgi:hypothetical protein